MISFECPKDLVLRSRVLGDQYVFFEEKSGSTHLLDYISGEILIKIYEDSVGFESIKNIVVDRADLSLDEAESFVEEFFINLNYLGLLIKVDCLSG